MCYLQKCSVACRMRNCNTIIDKEGHWVWVRCPIVDNAGLEWCGCGNREDDKPGPTVRAENRICDGCEQWAIDHSKKMYNDYGHHATRVREEERQNDEQRRLRDAENRSGTPMPAEQPALVYGTGTGWSAGQGGHDLGASAIHFDPGMGISAMPQELDLDDAGEGPSHSHDQGYNQRGDGGHNQRGGQGSGGWPQQ